MLRHMHSPRTRVLGSGKDIGKDEPAFGWELEPFVAFGSISGNVSSGEIQDKKECEHHALAMRPGILITRVPLGAYSTGPPRS